MSFNRLNLVGQKFGRLTVIADAGNRRKQSLWECLCDCGNLVKVMAGYLKSNHTKSCGCLKIDIHTIHGQAVRASYSKTYAAWVDMTQRCNNPRNKAYKNYGARGITVHPRWLNFKTFYEDVGDIPKNMTIERINNDGNYEPGNWRFATRKEQASNRRTNRWVEYNGETKTMTQWAEDLGLRPTTLRGRLNKWSIDRALTLPVQVQKCSNY